MAYVYLHRKKTDNEIFYVGIGRQAKYGRATTKKCRNRLWHNIALKHGYYYEIHADNISWGEACRIECELIALYGRRDLGTGCLANQTSGGDGLSGVNETLRAKMIENGKRFSGVNNPFYGKKHTPETLARIKESRKGEIRKPHSEETRRKLSISAKARPCNNKGRKDPKGAAKRTGALHPRHMGVVLCYDLNGNLVAEYSCNSEAAKSLGCNNANFVRRVIAGERKSWHGYVFKLKAA